MTTTHRTGPVHLGSDPGEGSEVAVIGAGVSGLVAARQLATTGARVTVFEAADHVGGQLRAATLAGQRVDVGAESVFTAAPGPLQLLEELGLGEELVGANRATTWIWTERGLRPLPDGFTPAGPSRLGPVLRSRVLSPVGLLRAGLEPLLPASRGGEDVAVGEELARRFGTEVVDRLVDPLLGGLHAGDVRTLSLQAATPQLAALTAKHRSLLLRRRPTPSTGPAFVTLTSGMGTMTERLATSSAGVEVRLGTRISAVTREAGRLRLSVDGQRPIDVDGVVVATSAAVARELLSEGSPVAAATLGQLRAASVVVAALAYPARAAELPAIAGGTGILVPSTSPQLLKAATFLSTKWPHHAHSDHVLIRASAGRAGDDRAIELDDEPLIERLHGELAQATGLDVDPLEVTVQRWPRTMPQLEVGHHERLATIRSALARDLPGVVVAGAPYHGPGLSSCLRSATGAATTLTTALQEAHA
ncbi:MAG: protoporphyrinogen oxidase [Nitriliruptor sp.]|nr:MAG: protoporphyrinogen oxidase [Nitriliruptor sp.]